VLIFLALLISNLTQLFWVNNDYYFIAQLADPEQVLLGQ